MEKELALVSRKLGQLIDAITEGLRGAGLQQKLDELEDRKAALEAALAAPPPTPVRLHPNLADVYREQVANLHAALADPALAVEAIRLLRELVDRVSIAPGDPPVVELHGRLAEMVRLAAGEDAGTRVAALLSGAVSDDLRRSVKVVAGTRSDRHLTPTIVL